MVYCHKQAPLGDLSHAVSTLSYLTHRPQEIDVCSFGSAICAVIALLGYGIDQVSGPKDFGSLVRLGVGAFTPMTFIKW